MTAFDVLAETSMVFVLLDLFSPFLTNKFVIK
nr:MAG TPA: hypothetical protein [Caudoviricetes sp.]